jgi:hypothetical protein
MEQPLKAVRPISFVAIPSFYDQDLKRIRLIHEHLMTSSLLLHADKKLEECMKNYNNGMCILLIISAFVR